MERSIDLIIGIIGILKAGGVYVPIDQNAPEDRINFTLEDSMAKMIISNSRRLFEKISVKILVLDINNSDISNLSTGNLDLKISIDDCMYIVYTSGTTGKPKGVMVTHRQLAGISYAWTLEYKLFEMPVRLMQVANCAFDVFW